MQKNIRNVSEIEQELEIVLTGEEFKKELEQEYEEARRSVSIKGFRKGHVPMGMIRRFVGPSIEAGLAEKLASKHFSTIAEEENIKPAGRAQIERYNLEGDTLTITLSYEIHPEFELKDFGAYSFTQADYTVDDEVIDREITMILKGHGTMVSVDEAAGDTDTVIGDVCKLGDEEQTNENHHFNLEYLPKDNPFRTALAGRKAGESAEVVIEPKEEGAETVSYRVDIKEVKRLELPELTDDLVREITGGRFENVADFKADVRIQLTQHFEAKSEQDLLEEISARLIEEHQVPTPKSMIHSFQNMLVENAKRQVGGKLPKGLDEREFMNAMKPNAEKHARWLLVSQKIAEVNGLTINDDDIKAYAEKEAAKNPSLKAEELLNTYMSSEFRDYIADTIMKDKIYDVIKSKVTIAKEARPVPSHEEEEE